MTKMYVSDEVFCKAIVDAVKKNEKASDVASRLGLEVTTVKSRANKLRKAGVPLPKLKSTRQTTDMAVLAKMVSDYQAECATNVDNADNADVTEENIVAGE